MTNLETDKEGITVYEIGYLILPSIPEDKLGDVGALIRGIITKEDGLEIDAEAPIKQPLAYSMSKTIGASRYVLTDAYFGWIKFEARPDKILVIKDNVEKIGEILRLLLIKAPRESAFTFAKARAALEEKKKVESGSEREVVIN